jgi:hypothetical protein
VWIALGFGLLGLYLLYLSQTAEASVVAPTAGDNAAFAGTNPLVIVGGMGTVEQLAQAIATAEGYFQPGSLPARTNNPGDLKLGDRGYGTEQGKTIFPNSQSGWDALYHEINLILNRQSNYYNPSMSILEIAYVWTGNDNPEGWAHIVASYLGVGVNTSLSDIMA